MTYVVPLRDIGLDDVPQVGGKNASLGEMLRALSEKGVAVPDGFALTAAAFRRTLALAGVADEIYRALDQLDPTDIRQLQEVAGRIRERVRAAPLPAAVAAELLDAYRQLSCQAAEDFTDVVIPFCRTLEEGRKVLAELERNGLRRGADGLEVYVMCEIPNNVVLAEEFSELFDGFSIGSNDLTLWPSGSIAIRSSWLPCSTSAIPA